MASSGGLECLDFCRVPSSFELYAVPASDALEAVVGGVGWGEGPALDGDRQRKQNGATR
jgi:hypothetical protein